MMPLFLIAGIGTCAPHVQRACQAYEHGNVALRTTSFVQALKASSVLDKVKDLLPFQTLPLFELAQDNANLGPNEVSKDVIKDVGENVKEGLDTAAPGEPMQRKCGAKFQPSSDHGLLTCGAVQVQGWLGQ